MSVNTADKIPNSDVAQIMSQIYSDDYEVEFKGYTHSKKGFVIQIIHLEKLQELDRWTNISQKYTCETDIDMNNQLVNLYFTKKQTKKWILPTLIYLSIIFICIYYLWNKYQQLLNYTNPI